MSGSNEYMGESIGNILRLDPRFLRWSMTRINLDLTNY